MDKQAPPIASFIFVLDSYCCKHRLCVIGNELLRRLGYGGYGGYDGYGTCVACVARAAYVFCVARVACNA